MRRVVLTRSARSDLEQINRYSGTTWGEARRNAYMAAILQRVQRLRIRPMASAARDEFVSGMRVARTGRHLVFFLHDAGTVTIVRVVHERANAKAAIVLAVKQGIKELR